MSSSSSPSSQRSSAVVSFERRMFTFLLLCLLVIHHTQPATAFQFNYEVERRVYERLDDFISRPVKIVEHFSRILQNEYHLQLADYANRDAFASTMKSLLETYKVEWVYYGTEEGMWTGYNAANWGTYKEPGMSYAVGSETEPGSLNDKYLTSCTDPETGRPKNCTHPAKGGKYIRCVNNCSYTFCPDPETQTCSESFAICALKQKWCRDYEIVETQEGDPIMGYIPRTDHCIDEYGVFSEQPGAIIQPDGSLGNCLYGDGVTRVQRDGYRPGNYHYCQKKKERGGMMCNSDAFCTGPNCTDIDTAGTDTDTDEAVCDDVFAGAFISRDFDPRYRPWYNLTRQRQRAEWSAPYPFFFDAALGISYTAPFYTKSPDGRQMFAGVVASDFVFTNIDQFIEEMYPQGSDTFVLIYEAAEPKYLVATSTNRSVSQKVLIEDETTLCADEAEDDATKCTAIRLTMDDLRAHEEQFDNVLLDAYLMQEEMGYPSAKLVASWTDNNAYISQSSSYSSGENLEWKILIISPVQRSDTDALTKSDPLFGIVCLIASLGFILCSLMFIFIFLKRKTRAVILSDWRFTLAFLLGCALLNLSTLTFLGENTDALCLTRMWSFHLLFAVALSPLFVKIYRMHRLVGTSEQAPAVISNPEAVAMTLPIVLIQFTILLVFSFADPPVPESSIEIGDSQVKEVTECTQNTNAFFYTELAYEGSLVIVGCILAFLTRNHCSSFNQAKELMLSMYNIFFVGLITAIITAVVDIDASGQVVLMALAIFCGTVFSSAAFVLPKIIAPGQSITRSMSTGLSFGSRGGKLSSGTGGKSTKKGAGSRKSVSFGEQLKDPAARSSPAPPESGWSVMEGDRGSNGGANDYEDNRAISGLENTTRAPTEISGFSAMGDSEVASGDENSLNSRESKDISGIFYMEPSSFNPDEMNQDQTEETHSRTQSPDVPNNLVFEMAV